MQVCRVFLVLMSATAGLANICNLKGANVIVDDLDLPWGPCHSPVIRYVNDPETGLKVVGNEGTCGVTVQCFENVLRVSGFGTSKDFFSNCGDALVKFVFGEFTIDCMN